MFCRYCGMKNIGNAVYCQQCGRMLYQEIQGNTIEAALIPAHTVNTGEPAAASEPLFLRAPITAMPFQGQGGQTYQDLPPTFPMPPSSFAPATLSAMSPAMHTSIAKPRGMWRYVAVAAFVGLLLGGVATWAGMTVLARMQQVPLTNGPRSSGQLPVHSATPTLAPTIAPTAVPPVVIEAEAATNTLTNGAAVAACTNCSGGEKVGYVGNGGVLQFNNIYKNISGNYTLTIYYCSGETRYGSMSVNGGPAVALTFSSTGDFNTPGPLTVTVYLIAGNNTIEFYNNSGWAPDFDRIVV